MGEGFQELEEMLAAEGWMIFSPNKNCSLYKSQMTFEFFLADELQWIGVATKLVE